MVKGKRLIILLCLYANMAQATAWLVPESSWNLYYQNEQSFESEKIKNFRLKQLSELRKLERQIAQTLRLQQEVRRSGAPEAAIQEDLKLCNIILAAQQKAYNQLLYNYTPKNHKSFLIEYGMKDYATIGLKLFNNTAANRRNSEIFQQGAELSTRLKILQNDKHVISIQPKISYINNDFYTQDTVSTEWRLLYGKYRLLNNKLLKKFKIVHFTNIEFAANVSSYKSTCQIIGEITQGLKFKNNWQILWQNHLKKTYSRNRIYQKTLREQLSIAKTINSKIKDSEASMIPTNEEVTLQLGYFVDYSLSSNHKYAEGVVFSLWFKI